MPALQGTKEILQLVGQFGLPIVLVVMLILHFFWINRKIVHQIDEARLSLDKLHAAVANALKEGNERSQKMLKEISSAKSLAEQNERLTGELAQARAELADSHRRSDAARSESESLLRQMALLSRPSSSISTRPAKERLARAPSRIRIRDENSGVVVCAFSDKKIIEDTSVQEIGEELERILADRRPDTLLLDFSNVDHLSSAAMGMMITLNKRVSERRGSLMLASINREIFEAFRITRLHKIYEIFPTVDQAIEAVRSRSQLTERNDPELDMRESTPPNPKMPDGAERIA